MLIPFDETNADARPVCVSYGNVVVFAVLLGGCLFSALYSHNVVADRICFFLTVHH